MNQYLLSELEKAFKKCSDSSLHPEYTTLLQKLDDIKLTQELVDFLCEKVSSKKLI